MDNIVISVCCPHCGRHYMRNIQGLFQKLTLYEVFDCSGTLFGPGCGGRFVVEIELTVQQHVFKLVKIKEKP